MDTLEGRTAVVTGAAAGIGKAVAEDLATSGMNVVLADIEEARLQAAADEVARATGARTLAVQTDVADAASVEALADATYAEFGATHVLCNNAGVLLQRAIPDLVLDDWRWLLGVNVMGVLHGIYAFLPRMLAAGEPGHIVNTSSIAGVGGTGIYGTSKVAVLAITEGLRNDLADTPIGVSALLPGKANTLITSSERNRAADYGRRIKESPEVALGTLGTDPAHCARRMREGILNNELYVFGGLPIAFRDRVAARARERADAIIAAMDAGLEEPVTS